jgi:hypothetical protein
MKTKKPMGVTAATRAVQLAAITVALASCDDGDKADGSGDTGTEESGSGDTGVEDTGADDTGAEDTGIDGSPGDGSGASDVGDPDGSGESRWPAIPTTEQGGLSGPTGYDPESAAPAGAARAGRVRGPSTTFSGPESKCRVNDWVLSNERIRVCIADERSVGQMTFTGGHIIDMERVGEPGNDRLDLFVPSNGIAPLTADEITLLRDGSDGGAAVLRVRGVNLVLKLIAGVIGDIGAGSAIEAETEYRLAPGSEYLEVVTWIRSGTSGGAQVQAGDILLPGDGTTPWFGSLGIEPPTGSVPLDFYAAVADNRSYGVYAPGMSVLPFDASLLAAPINPVTYARGVVRAAEVAAVRRYVTVGSGDTESLRDALADVAPRPAGVAPVVLHADPVGSWQNARWEIRSADASIAIVRLDGAGDATAKLQPGVSYVAKPLDWIGPDAPEVSFVAGTERVDLPSPGVGLLSVTVTAGPDAAPSPARVLFDGPLRVERFVERGAVTVPLLPGSYEVEVSRGEEWSSETRTVEVAAGAEASTAVSLVRTWETPNWASGDFHQHSAPSIDSDVAVTERIRTNLAAGVDFIAPSDHDMIADFAGTVEQMGVDDLLHVIQGLEISPAFGHMNAFPMAFDPSLTAGGAVQLATRVDRRRARQLNVNDMIDQALAHGAEVIQINHPRDTLPMFTSAGYDPLTGPAAVPANKWPKRIDSIEIYNDPRNVCIVMRDWFSLLSRGFRVTGVGNSDTHSTEAPAGFPRNYLHVADDSPTGLTDQAITDAIRAGRVTVSGAAMIAYTDGTLPGDTVVLESGRPLVLPTRVTSTAWSAIDELVVFVNGREVQRVSLVDAPIESLVDWDDSISVSIERDSYVMILGTSSLIMDRVTQGRRPFAFINPVYVDVGGDGWTPPGVAGPGDVPEITGIGLCD